MRLFIKLFLRSFTYVLDDKFVDVFIITTLDSARTDVDSHIRFRCFDKLNMTMHYLFLFTITMLLLYLAQTLL